GRLPRAPVPTRIRHVRAGRRRTIRHVDLRPAAFELLRSGAERAGLEPAAEPARRLGGLACPTGPDIPARAGHHARALSRALPWSRESAPHLSAAAWNPGALLAAGQLDPVRVGGSGTLGTGRGAALAVRSGGARRAAARRHRRRRASHGPSFSRAGPARDL